MYLNGFDQGEGLDGFFNLKKLFKGATDIAKNPFKTPLRHLKQHVAVLTKPKNQDLPPEWVAPPLPPPYTASLSQMNTGLINDPRYQVKPIASNSYDAQQQNLLGTVPLWAWGAGAGLGLLGLYLIMRKSR